MGWIYKRQVAFDQQATMDKKNGLIEPEVAVLKPLTRINSLARMLRFGDGVSANSIEKMTDLRFGLPLLNVGRKLQNAIMSS